MYDFSKPVAAMSQHPANPNLWGLKNLSEQKWVTKLSDGAVKDVEPGRSVSLAVGTKILFGKAEGEIRV
jgi:eukaryotic-like serine/threonine-protein kinase